MLVEALLYNSTFHVNHPFPSWKTNLKNFRKIVTVIS